MQCIPGRINEADPLRLRYMRFEINCLLLKVVRIEMHSADAYDGIGYMVIARIVQIDA